MCERVLRTSSWREKEKRREREQNKGGERVKKRKRERNRVGGEELSLFYSHFLHFSGRYVSHLSMEAH